MTYSDSAKGMTICPKRAAQEIRKHGVDPAEFFAEFGNRKFYAASAVLAWLGY